MRTIQIEDPDTLEWAAVGDVIVVGYGGAGACAALQAREDGADVIIVDRFGGGGTTAYSGGIVYAGGTPFQAEAGFADTPAKMFEYLSLEVGDAVKPATLRRFCEGSAADLEWLQKKGVGFGSSFFGEKTNFPPEGKFLYFSGNENTSAYAARTPPMPRGHRVVGAGYGGSHYFAALSRAVEQAGIRVRRHERVCSLVLDANGGVVGIEVLSLPDSRYAEHQQLLEKSNPWIPLNNKAGDRMAEQSERLEREAGRRLLIRARSGVILATGSFAYGREMLREHAPSFAPHYGVVHRLATLGNDGGGIELGRSAGAATGRMDSLYIARNIAPPGALLYGIVVNQEGQRFINEDSYTAFLGGAILRQSDSKAWLILPSSSFYQAVRQCIFTSWHLFKFFGLPTLLNILRGGTRRGSRVEVIARNCGIDPSGLQHTIDAHDQAIVAGTADALGKNESYRKRLGKGPFFALDVSISNGAAFTPFMTLGGLVVNEETGAVRRLDGGAIVGLYAAGLCAVGLHSNGYISGISLADGVFSGRRAGRSAVQRGRGAGSTPSELLDGRVVFSAGRNQ